MNNTNSLVYYDWLLIYYSYYQLLEVREALFELGIPFVISTICTALYCEYEKVDMALQKLTDMLPSITSIMIGFTVALITILLTSGSEAIKELKSHKSKRIMNGKSITLFQILNIQFSYLLLVEVLMLLVLFLHFFMSGLVRSIVIDIVFLFVLVYLLLSVLFCIVRSITNLHFAFFGSTKRKDRSIDK